MDFSDDYKNSGSLVEFLIRVSILMQLLLWCIMC